MRKYIYPIVLMFLYSGLLYSQKTSTRLKASGNIATGNYTGNRWVHTPDISKSNAFVENAGQFAGEVSDSNDSKILYRYTNNNMMVYFTASGVIYKLLNPEKVSDEEWDKYAEKNGLNGIKANDGDKDAGHVIPNSAIVYVNWENISPSAEVSVEDPTTFYFNFYRPDIDKNKIFGGLKGYKKLVYKNIYPGIDIEYDIADEGIKYTYILHPGANPSDIKMEYRNASIEKDGNNISINTKAGNIIDHAPNTYSGSNEHPGENINSSFRLLTNNTVGFKLNGIKGTVTQTTVIDPWVTPAGGLSGIGQEFIGDIDVDGSGNSVIYGCDPNSSTCTLQQYNSAGTMNWSINLSTKYGYSLYQGDVATDVAGNIYVTIGLGGSSTGYYNTIKLNSAGTTLLWGKTSPTTSVNDMYEEWTLSFNCDQSSLLQSGGGIIKNSGLIDTLYYNVGIFEPVNTGSGVEGKAYHNFNHGEIYDSKFASNGMFYTLSADSTPNDSTSPMTAAASGPYNMLSCYNSAAGYSRVFSVQTKYSYTDAQNKQGTVSYEGSVGYNGLAASCNYLYTSNGQYLEQRSLTTGALIKQVTVPGGSSSSGSVNGGMVIDKCGDVYFGANKTIYEYSPTLSQLGTVGTFPDRVYDLALSTDGKTIYACGGAGTTSFVAAVNVNPCSAVTATATGPTCSAGGTATAQSTMCGGPYTYSWAPGGATGATVTNLNPGTYTVTVTSPECIYNFTDTASVVVPSGGAPMTINTSSSPSSCSAKNGTAWVSSITNGVAPYTYSWNTSPVQTTDTAKGLAPGTYKVIVTETGGCTDSATVVVTSSGATITPTVTSTNVLCYGGSTGSVNVTNVTGGSAPYTYAWSANSATTTSVSNLQAGVYTVTVTDANGCSGSVTDTVKQPTLLTLISQTFPASCYGTCNGQITSIPKGGTQPYGYLYSNGATTPNITGLCAGTYSVVITDANGCKVDTVGLTVTQPDSITGTLTTTTTKCNQANGGACVSATGGTGPYTYLWSTSSTASCISNVASQTYTVTITDANKCTETLSVLVPSSSTDTVKICALTNVSCNGGNNGSLSCCVNGPNPPFTYSWSTTPVQTTSTVSNLTAGTYTLTVTDATGCKTTKDTTITEPTKVVATPGSAQTICIGQSATLSVLAKGGTPGYTFTWMPGNLTGPSVTVSPTVTTTYTITTSDTNSCPGAPVTITVTVNPPLSIQVSPDRYVCPGGSAVFTASASGGDGNYTYTWLPATGLNVTTGATVIATASTTTEYTVTVHDGCGTSPVTDSVKLIVDPLPVINFTADTLQSCSPLCVNFSNLTTITAPATQSSWAWNFGDGTTSNKDSTSHCYKNAGVYSVSLIVSSDSGCTDSLTINNMITVYSHPVAAYTASPQTTSILNPTVTFTNQSTDAYGIKGWLWQFNDGTDSTSTAKNPVYAFSDTGTFCPQLVVTNIHGCMDSVTHCVYIEPFYTIYIPNAFTPNGDGIDDEFTAKGVNICSFEMYIFDRWGMKLYHTNDMNKGWNGCVAGQNKIAQEDTYVYLIIAVDCIKHAEHRFIGKVTLIK